MSPLSYISAPTATTNAKQLKSEVKFISDYLGVTDVINDIKTCNWGSILPHSGLVVFNFVNQEDGAGEVKGAANVARIRKAEQAAESAKNMRAISPSMVRMLKDSGYDIHELKGGLKADRYHDIFQNKAGDLFVNLKNGSGEPQPLGINIHNL